MKAYSSDLDDAAVDDDGDDVGAADGRQPVGDEQRGAAAHGGGQRALHRLLRPRVQGAGEGRE